MRHHAPRCATTRQSEPSGSGRHRMDERVRRDPRIGPAIDRSLIDRARNGDLDAFESIVNARMDAVYRLTSAILGNEADARDAAQETFVAAWRRLSRLREPDKFEAWLQRVAVNAARQTWRARSRRRVPEIPSSTVIPPADRAAPPLLRAPRGRAPPVGAAPAVVLAAIVVAAQLLNNAPAASVGPSSATGPSGSNPSVEPNASRAATVPQMLGKTLSVTEAAAIR